jgi:hypothetical protein
MIDQKFYHPAYGWGMIIDIEIPISLNSIVLLEWDHSETTNPILKSLLRWKPMGTQLLE